MIKSHVDTRTYGAQRLGQERKNQSDVPSSDILGSKIGNLLLHDSRSLGRSEPRLHGRQRGRQLVHRNGRPAYHLHDRQRVCVRVCGQSRFACLYLRSAGLYSFRQPLGTVWSQVMRSHPKQDVLVAGCRYDHAPILRDDRRLTVLCPNRRLEAAENRHHHKTPSQWHHGRGEERGWQQKDPLDRLLPRHVTSSSSFDRRLTSEVRLSCRHITSHMSSSMRVVITRRVQRITSFVLLWFSFQPTHFA